MGEQIFVHPIYFMPTLKLFSALLFIATAFSACYVTSPVGTDYRQQGISADTLITQSLFADKASTVSEEAVQKILDGSYQLPEKLRVAIVKLESPQQRSRFFWGDEDYLKNLILICSRKSWPHHQGLRSCLLFLICWFPKRRRSHSFAKQPCVCKPMW